jgi:tetratricopeptide (TPR) repeat protein
VALRSKVLEARALLSQQKFAEARTVCSEAIATAATDPATLRSQQLAKVVLARCDISEGKTADALQNLQKMIQENDSTDSQLFAALYNAQGEALQKEQKWEQAVLAYLHSDLLFSNNPETHAEALYHLSQLWAKLGEPQRAAEAKEKLTTLYAGSAWAKK